MWFLLWFPQIPGKMEADQSVSVKAQGAVTTQIKQPHALSVGTTEASTTWENKDALYCSRDRVSRGLDGPQTHYAAEDGIGLLIFLPLCLQSWDQACTTTSDLWRAGDQTQGLGHKLTPN